MDRESGIFCVGDYGCEGGDMRGRRYCGRSSNAFGDLFALVDFGYFLFQKLVSFLAKG